MFKLFIIIKIFLLIRFSIFGPLELQIINNIKKAKENVYF